MGSLLPGAFTLAGLSATSHAVIAGLLLALNILHAVAFNICALSLTERVVPDDLLGQVRAASRVLGLVGLAVGSGLGGVLAAVNLILPVAAGATCFAACTAVAAISLAGRQSPDGPYR